MSKPTFRLGLTEDNVLQFLKDYQTAYNAKNEGFSQLLYSSVPFGDGDTNDFIGPPFRVNIGIGDLRAEQGDCISDRSLFRVMVAMGHEQAHVRQSYEDQMSCGTFGRLAAITHVATQYNSKYYALNYRANIREIQAEFSGIKSARKQLIQYVRDDMEHSGFESLDAVEKFADSVALDYVNFRAYPGKSYFVKYPTGYGFTSMSQVESAFQDAMNSSLEAKRNYIHPQKHNRSFRDDDFALLTGLCNKKDDGNPWRKIGQKVLDAPTGKEQDYLMACLMQYANYNDPGLRFKAFPDNDAKRLETKMASFEKAFGCKPPEGPTQANEQLERARSHLMAEMAQGFHPIRDFKVQRANEAEYQASHRPIYLDVSDLVLSDDAKSSVGPEF